MAKRKNPTYSDEFRATAVLTLEAAGYPEREGALTHVSKHLGVSRTSLRRWFKREQNPPPDKLVHKKREELVTRFENIAHMFLDFVEEDLGSNGVDAVRGMTAAAIATDKLQLLNNKPTAILKLQQAIEQGKITREQAAEKWPALMKQYDNINA